VRDFASAQGIADAEALQKGMEVKSVEFVRQGAEVYLKA
jgi:phosphomethylpyrimidine synthase